MTEHALPIFALGAAISALGTVVGFGGGFLMTPALTVGFGLPIHSVVPVVLLAIVPASGMSSYLNWRKDLIDPRVGLVLGVPTAAAAAVAARVSSSLSGEALRWIFAASLGAIGLKLLSELGAGPARLPEGHWLRRLLERKPFLEGEKGGEGYRVSAPALAAVGAISGTLAGLVGIGGGVLKTPALARVFWMPPRAAAATSLAVVCASALSASVSFMAAGGLDLGLAAWVVGGFLAGAALGQAFEKKVTDGQRRALMAISLVAAAGTMVAF